MQPTHTSETRHSLYLSQARKYCVHTIRLHQPSHSPQRTTMADPRSIGIGDNLGYDADVMAENEPSQGSVRVVSGSGFRYVIPFPWRLHQMLEEIEKAGDASIVSWLHDGQHFQVHNAQDFVDKVIPKFFKQKSYKSFQRQLHLYGFHRETEGMNRGMSKVQ
jgi:HSF-type DNA-binding